jgi:hypothetical protein
MTELAETERYKAGVKAYASQFSIAESQVPGILADILGPDAATDSILATGAAWGPGPLSWHIEWALKNGLRCEEIEAIVRVIAPYVGYPKASVAMELVRNIVKGKER